MPPRLSRSYQKQGLPPGTPRYTGDHTQPVRITAFDVDEGGGCTRHDDVDVQRALELARADTFTWVDVEGLSDVDAILELGRGLGIHGLAIEDILQVGTRPKVELHDGHLLVVLKLIHLDDPPPGEDRELDMEIEHIGAVLTDGALLTFQEHHDDPFDGVRRQLLEGIGPLRKPTAARLLHAIVDAVVDDAFDAIEVMGRAIEALEGELLEDPPEDAMEQIQEHRRNALLVLRVLRPLREVAASLKRLQTDLLPDRVDAYWTDVTDHLDQLLETLGLYREMVMGMVELHHTAVSNKLNDTMKVLTVISVLFLPLSFLAGLYGMNFSYMPELQVWWGYFALLGAMAVIAIAMAGWFKWRGWF